MLAVLRAGRGGPFLRFPVATMGTGGWCKYCKSKLDWCDQRGVSSRMRLEEGEEQLKVLMSQEEGEM